MNIVGLETLVFGVDDVDACAQFLMDYGLHSQGAGTVDARYCALDGTSIILRRRDDPNLPSGPGTATMLRKTIYGVGDLATLNAISSELSTDREVRRLTDDSIETIDDQGFVIGFQLTQRKPFNLEGERVNAPGSVTQRPINHVAVDESAIIHPRTLSHVVYFVPDAAKAEAFYVNRLQFVCTDRFLGTGPFLRAPGAVDHHCLFMIQTPPFMQGCEHFTFHLGGPSEVLQAGNRFMNKGYTSFWGPGRHKMGSNWFWYFNSPLGCHIEYDADMDLHDESWVARAVPMSADSSQLFLFQQRDKWAPSGGPPPKS